MHHPAGVRGLEAERDLARDRKRVVQRQRAALVEPAIQGLALDQVHAAPGTPLGAAREVALFPPMTGG